MCSLLFVCISSKDAKCNPIRINDVWLNNLLNTLPAKNMEYFYYSDFVQILWSVQGVSELEIHTY